MKKLIRKILIRSFQIFMVSLIITSCQEPILWEVDSTEQVIAEFVSERPEYSEFAHILDTTNLTSLLSVRGPFTLFLPSDSVMNVYYQDLGVNSFLDLDPEVLKNLALNHMIPSMMETSDFGLGAIRDLNGLGDYIVTEFDGAEIILNKVSRIIKRNVAAANGVIHLIDKVLVPVEKSVYAILAEDEAYSLFAKGLELTGLKDTIDMIDFPYGNDRARTRFTILAVADTTFNRYGITNSDELVAYFTDAPDSVTYLNNDFYRYMEYHCLGETYYLNDLENNRVYPILSYDNNISVNVTDDYKLNYDSDTETYTGFIIEESNIPGKNGTIHTIYDLLPVFEPEPSIITFETTDYFDLKQGDYYGKYYYRWFDGVNTFEHIKWEGDYLLYYFKDHDTGKLLNDDCLSMSGWWWCEITTPKIMKGNYRITANLWANQTNYSVYVDGVNTATINMADAAESTSWGEFVWTETETHKIRVVTKSAGMLFWDTVIFNPIN